MKAILRLTVLSIALLLFGSTLAHAAPSCGPEICVELYGFSPITGEVFVDSAVVPKGPGPGLPTPPFCLALNDTFPPNPPPPAITYRHFWLAVLPPGGTGVLEDDLVFIGQVEAIPVYNKLPFVVPYFSYVPFPEEGAVSLECFSQEMINTLPSGSTYLFAGGYTVPLQFPLTLADLLGHAVSGVSVFSVTIGD